MMNIVLVEPEIPPNTGNIARICAATLTTLHLIEPLGFNLNNRDLKRAGMDYWQHLNWKKWENWKEFTESLSEKSRLWFVESGGPLIYTEVKYSTEDYLVFGRESAGLPVELLKQNKDRWLRIPMFNPSARSINLSNCVALVLYEALRQLGFKGEIFDGKISH
ncbi:MAG TPA: tRNA (cytidine(34)-2'-O)-methyltransferase [Verrucomicrobiota bacterium]|nr:tRNA (cytidine(34)-2'-O)-methyltransferase [Verrucomicrobiota bacterium]